MKYIATGLVLCLGVGTTALVSAQPQQSSEARAHHASNESLQLDIPQEAVAAVDVVERFNAALGSGDLETVEKLLAPDVLVLESGGAERSREEYLGHHAASDAEFLKGAHRQLLRQRARISGGLVWVGSESELHTQDDDKPLTLLSTETMVLQKTGEGWRIAHIHWSSRTKR